jgi:hypothetical protein
MTAWNSINEYTLWRSYVRQGRHNLSEERSGFIFLTPLACDDVIKQLAAVSKLEHEVVMGVCLVHVVELADVLVVELFERFNLMRVRVGGTVGGGKVSGWVGESVGGGWGVGESVGG